MVVDSAPTEGVRVNPPSQIRSLFPILNNPAKRHRAAGFTKEQFHYAFANMLSREDSDKGVLLAHRGVRLPGPLTLDLCRTRLGGGRRQGSRVGHDARAERPVRGRLSDAENSS